MEQSKTWKEEPDWLKALALMQAGIVKAAIEELLTLARLSLNRIAAEVGVEPKAVRKWRDEGAEPGATNALRMLALRDLMRQERAAAERGELIKRTTLHGTLLPA